jgi:hypothetical protein
MPAPRTGKEPFESHPDLSLSCAREHIGMDRWLVVYSNRSSVARIQGIADGGAENSPWKRPATDFNGDYILKFSEIILTFGFPRRFRASIAAPQRGSQGAAAG